MLLQSLRVINRSRPLVNRHARFPAFFDEKCLSSDHSQVIELRFSNGFFRFHCDREYVLSYFTPFGAVLNELADNDNAFRSIGNPSEDVKISVQKGTKNFKLANQNTLGEVLSNIQQFVIEFPNKRTVKLKFKGDHFDLLPWESVELKTKKNDKALSRKMVTQNLIQERDDLIAEFTPLFHQYKQIVNSARWRETFNLFYQYLMLGTIGDLIFFHIGWDTMEPVTFVLFQCFLMLSAAFFFDQNAHYVSCSRKLRMMRRMHLLSKRRHFDLHHFRRISDRLFRIEDKLQSNIEPSARPLIDHCR